MTADLPISKAAGRKDACGMDGWRWWVCPSGGVTRCWHACPVHTARPGLSVAGRWKRRQVDLVRSCIFKLHDGRNRHSSAAESRVRNRGACGR